MIIRKILLSYLVLATSFGVMDAFAGKQSFVTGVDPNTLMQDITSNQISVARMDNISGPSDNLVIAPNNLIRDAVSWDKIVLGRNLVVRSGPRFVLLKNNAVVGLLNIGVFADNNTAVKKYEEILNHASVGPDKDLSNELGDKAREWNMRRIDFVRDNVFVSFSLFLERLNSKGVSEDLVLNKAKQIDKALSRGLHGVDRSSVFRMPRFTEVEIPKKILPGKDIKTKVHIALPLGVNGNSEIEIIKSLIIPASRTKSEDSHSEKVTYEITYITPNCVVVSKQVELTITN